MFALGTGTLHRIVDIDPFALPLSFIMPGAEIGAIRHEEGLLAPHFVDFQSGNLLLGVQSFLLRAGGLNILIDTCVGEDKERPRRADWHRRTHTGFLQRLAAAGVRPEEIDVVFCTHLHADHAGWNTRLENGRWIPTFPNARYLCGTAELAHWQAMEQAAPGQHNHGLYADSVLPIVEAGLMRTVDDGHELARGLEVVGLPGHTPGQKGLCLDCGAHKALFCGDAIHSPVQVFRPEWTSAFCSDEELAVATRRALLETAAADGSLLVPAHLRHFHAMRITRKGSAFRPVFE